MVNATRQFLSFVQSTNGSFSNFYARNPHNMHTIRFDNYNKA